MSKVEILGIPQSTMVRVVRIVAEEMEIPYELVSAAPHSPPVDAVHPLGKVPVLRHGDVTLFESRAIIAYLERSFPDRPLGPRDPLGAAAVEQWVSLAISTFDQTLIRDYLFAHLFPGTPDGKPDAARIANVAPRVEAQLSIIDAAVADGFLASASFSLADAYVFPMLEYLRNLPESAGLISRSRNLPAYMNRVGARPSVRATAPPAG